VRRLVLLLAVAALAGCVTFGDHPEGEREKSQEFLRSEKPNGLLEGLAAFLNGVASR
jgi:hypothetical protein